MSAMSKWARLRTRASIQAAGDFYLCPLSALQVPTERLALQVAALRESSQPLLTVERTGADGQTHCIAHGYEDSETITAQWEGVSSTWTERRRLLRSQAAARAAETALRARLGQAQAALSELSVRRQGKPVLADRAAVEQAVAETVRHFRVAGLLRVTVSEQVTEQPVRAYRDRPATVRTQSQFTISNDVEPDALASAIEQLGWRVYATNQVTDGLSLPQAVEAYRDEYVVERNFGRLKGRPLLLSPMYVERDDHATGLVRLLSLALRILTLMEFVVRRQLALQGAALAGLYAASHDPSHHGALAGGFPGDDLDPGNRNASDPTPCDCSFSSSATGVGPLRVHTHDLYATVWGFSRTPVKMSER